MVGFDCHKMLKIDILSCPDIADDIPQDSLPSGSPEGCPRGSDIPHSHLCRSQAVGVSSSPTKLDNENEHPFKCMSVLPIYHEYRWKFDEEKWYYWEHDGPAQVHN